METFWKMESARKKRGKNLFILVSLVGVIFLGAIMVAFWYLVTPRLLEIHRVLPAAFGIALTLAYGTVFALFVLIIVSAYLERDLVSAKKITVRILFPLAMMIARIFRIPSDEIRSSFIEMNNALVKSSCRLVSGERLLLLLPHCLQNIDCPYRVTCEIRNCKHCGKCKISDLIDMCDRYGIKMSIATGGTLARRVIVETRPKAIVAVACERDLTSGIQDSYPIPVIGILNDRPYGPCRNTSVDLGKVEEAVAFFLGIRPLGLLRSSIDQDLVLRSHTR